MLALSLWITPSPTFAAEAWCGTTDYWHVGWTVDPNYEVRGARADLNIRDPALCSDFSGRNLGELRETFSYSWSMLSGVDTQYGESGWAQVGYQRLRTELGGLRPLEYRWEWVRSYPSTTRYFGWYGAPSPASTHKFAVSYYATIDQRAHMLIDQNPVACQNGTCGVTNFDPLAAWDNTLAHFSAEVKDHQSDITGTLNYRTNFREIQVRNGNLDWVHRAHTSTYGDDGPYPESYCYFHRVDEDDSTLFRVYTNPLDHEC